jgi:hypothetical protein
MDFVIVPLSAFPADEMITMFTLYPPPTRGNRASDKKQAGWNHFRFSVQKHGKVGDPRLEMGFPRNLTHLKPLRV